MIEREKIIKAFDCIAPSDELVNKILAEDFGKRRTIRIHKKSLAALICACAVMLCGATAAALGNISFETLFGNHRIRVDNNELADSLMGTVSDVRYKVSDKDYKITVKGAAGDKYNIITIAEISRADGIPITEYLNIPAEQEYLEVLWGDSMAIKHPFGEVLAGSSGFGANINGEGNIELYINLTGSNKSVDGCRVISSGKNFYPDFTTLQNFQRENGVYYDKEKGKFGWYEKKTHLPAEVDDSAIKLLDLEWELSFKYNVSDAGLEKKVCKDPAESFVYYWNVSEMTSSETMPDGARHITFGDPLLTTENIAAVKSIEVDAMKGSIEYEFPINEYLENKHFHTSPSSKNEFYLIKNDGTKIKMTLSSSMFGYGDNGIVEGSIGLYYADDNYVNILTEINDVVSISINGTIYDLT